MSNAVQHIYRPAVWVDMRGIVASVRAPGPDETYLDVIREEARTRLQGQWVTNPHAGERIEIPGSGLKKTLWHAAAPEHARSVMVLPALLAAAVWVRSDMNRREYQRRTVPWVHHFEVGLHGLAGDYRVRLVVRGQIDGWRFYDHNLDPLP